MNQREAKRQACNIAYMLLFREDLRETVLNDPKISDEDAVKILREFNVIINELYKKSKV